MSAQPLARFLVDFARERTRAEAAAHRDMAKNTPAPDLLEPHWDELAAARAAGREEGRAEERRIAERTLADLRRESEVQFAADRAAWVRDQGEAFANLLMQGLTAIEQRVTEQVAALLSGLVLDAARRRMIDEMAEVLRGLLAADEPVLRIEGPADLLDALRLHLRDAAPVEMIVSAIPDVQVSVGSARLETRLTAWRDRVRADLL